MNLPKEEVASILGALRTLYNARKGTIRESEYLAISPVFQRPLPEHKRAVFKSVFDGLFRQLTIKKVYKERLQARAEL